MENQLIINETETVPAKQVKILVHPAECEVHGWMHGSVLPTEFPLTDGYKDAKGQNVYVRSTLRNRSVHVDAAQYEIIN